MTEQPLLEINDLVVDYGRADKKAVDTVTLSVGAGETLGLVGESGSGKSSIARAALGLTPYGGSIRFEGQELRDATSAQWKLTRARLQMIFQDPYATLDPRQRIGAQVAEPFVVHGRGSRRESAAHVAELLERVGLDSAMARRYPHEFSGGQRQRIAIARAIALHPSLIVCDEPTSALDVSVQSQVLTLLEALQREQNISYLFIAHNLGVVRRISHRVAVMYLGRIVEAGPTDEVFRNPQHPYTRALLEAVLEPDPSERHRVQHGPHDLTSPIDLARLREDS